MSNGEVLQWLEKSKTDLKVAEYLLEGGFFEDAAFHAQQSAEKAIKSVYLKKFGEVSKSHELVGIGKKIGLEKHLLAECAELTEHYLVSRYPGFEEGINEDDAKKAVDTAKKVLEWSK